MRFGLALPHYGYSLPDGGAVSFGRVRDFARRAERLGFHSVWISDHFVFSLAKYGGPTEPYGTPEAVTTLAGLAAATERVRLGTLVLCSWFRHPAILAKAATAIDLLSGGRLDLGMGAGSRPDEFEQFGYPPGTTAERFQDLEETLAVLNLLFEDGPATWEGRRFRLQDAYNRPRPAQAPRPPLWVGGKGGPRVLGLVARYADGWNGAWTWTPEDYGLRAGALREACERSGRDPSTVRLSVGLLTLVGEDERDLVARYRALQRWTPGGGLDGQMLEDWARNTLTGTPEPVLDRVARFAALGVEEVVVSLASVPFAMYDDSMLDLFAEAVIGPAAGL
jgi:probable F420-dependent oxidoreductase